MKFKSIMLSLAALSAAAVVCFAADAQMGTWKLNDAKSNFNPSSAKNTTVVYATAGDSVKITVDGVDTAGKPTHNEWTGKFDGKDYAVTGDPASDMRSYVRVNDHTLTLTIKQAGKVTMTGEAVVSTDGMVRTLTINGMDTKGQKYTNIAVYNKS